MSDTKKEPFVLTDDIRAALAPEFKALEDTAFAKGVTEGSTRERFRIVAVFGCGLRGHEELIQKLAFDGKTTPDEAREQVIAAEKTKQASKLTEIRKDAVDPAPVVPVDPTKKEEAKEIPAEQKEATAQKLGHEAEAYIAEQGKLGKTVEMIDAIKFVYQRAGVPLR